MEIGGDHRVDVGGVSLAEELQQLRVLAAVGEHAHLDLPVVHAHEPAPGAAHEGASHRHALVSQSLHAVLRSEEDERPAFGRLCRLGAVVERRPVPVASWFHVAKMNSPSRKEGVTTSFWRPSR